MSYEQPKTHSENWKAHGEWETVESIAEIPAESVIMPLEFLGIFIEDYFKQFDI